MLYSIVFKLRWKAHGSPVHLGVGPMLADVFARPADQEMLQQRRQRRSSFSTSLSLLAQRARLDAQINPVVGVEQADLIQMSRARLLRGVAVRSTTGKAKLRTN